MTEPRKPATAQKGTVPAKPAAAKSKTTKPAAAKPSAAKSKTTEAAAGKSKPTRPAAPSATKPAARAKKPAPRADLGAPIDGWFAKQPQPQRAILEALRALVQEAAPGAAASLKWGMPFFTLGGTMCALTSHKAHVNLVLSGPPGTFADPDGLLVGDGKTGRHLRLTRLADLPTEAVRGWLQTAAALARKG